ncbi:MAG: hypothetical protein OXI80_15155 [Caldilineaceae bacterium]|nr:hypothetical protein [Caldilineaceae bacterium]MDE0339007.1 hypothetical protein [Caldilineaceae bacterium]
MKTFRIFLALTLMLSALAVTDTAYAHPNLPGYCQMPDGTLNSGHCTDAENAAGGHDVHLPANSAPNTPNSNTPPPPGGNDNDGTGGPPPVGSGPDGDGDGDGSDSTPVYTGVDCHIQHAATPAQICSVPNGLQYWYIGADGSAQPGPFLPDSPKITFSGTNPMTGKSVTIDYITENEETLLRVSTFYPDNEYDTNKPYVFTLDPGHTVNHIQW